MCSLSTSFTRSTHVRYRKLRLNNAAGLALLPVGESAEGGLPDHLQVRLNDGLRLVPIPTEGFGWFVGNRVVAKSRHSQCVISITAGRETGVDEVVKMALQNGVETVTDWLPQTVIDFGIARALSGAAVSIWAPT